MGREEEEKDKKKSFKDILFSFLYKFFFPD